MAVSANSYQVGGAHYKKSYEHWDFCLDCGLDYLVGNATKYLARAGKKNGIPAVSDLQKAAHYVVKIGENAKRLVLRPRMPTRWVTEQTGKFLLANNVTGGAADAIWALVVWELPVDILRAHSCIEKLLTAEPFVPAAKPVPIEDSNKHAERATDANNQS